MLVNGAAMTSAMKKKESSAAAVDGTRRSRTGVHRRIATASKQGPKAMQETVFG
jgi:hypothetical protein